MNPKSISVRLLVSCVWTVVLLGACQPVQPETARSTGPAGLEVGQNIVKPTDPAEVQIQNALSALPATLAAGATVYGFPAEEGGEMVLLKEGNNGWTCYTDWPATDGNDPQCNDAMWESFMGAIVAGEPPKLDHFGIGYMLAGGVDFSNTDPAATEPDPQTGWIVSYPHLMPILPKGYAPAQFSADPTTGEPFVMWAGTPYAHLHVPVNLTPFDEPDPQLRNAMRAAPLAIAQDATIVAYPPEGQTEPVVLRQGTNGWTCWTDWAVTPTDDPMCLDEEWMAWMAALATGADYTADRLGIGYMLQGGTSPSNTDPLALEPPAGEEWQVDPPHVMFIVPEDLSPGDFATDVASGGPYIRFEGTPFEHLMVPVQTAAPAGE